MAELSVMRVVPDEDLLTRGSGSSQLLLGQLLFLYGLLLVGMIMSLARSLSRCR